MKRNRLSKAKQNSKIRNIGGSVFAMGLAILMIAGLIRFVGIDLGDLIEAVRNLPIWVFFLFLMMTGVNFMIGSSKWKIAVDYLTTDRNQQPGYLFYFVFTVLGAFLGLFVPVQISTLAVRSISFRLSGYGSLQKGAVTSLVSQFQDVIMILFFFFAGLTVLLWQASPLIWLLILLFEILGGYLFFRFFAHPIVEKFCTIKLPETKSPTLYTRALDTALHFSKQIAQKGLFHPELTIPLYRLSLLRFANLAARSYLLSLALGLQISPIAIISVSALVQLSLLIAVTPGNLGLIEWGWVGLLSLVGVSRYDAGQFALTTRLLGYASTLLILLLVGVLFALFRKRIFIRQADFDTR